MLLSLGAGGVAAQAPLIPRYYAGAGFEALGIQGQVERALGLTLQAGAFHQFDRLGLRLGVTYFRRSRGVGDFTQALRRAVGPTIEVSMDLTTTRLRPYALAGWGMYHITGNRRSPTETFTVQRLTATAIGGLGLRYRYGQLVEVFAEGRLHGFTHGRDWGYALLPITFGLRL